MAKGPNASNSKIQAIQDKAKGPSARSTAKWPRREEQFKDPGEAGEEENESAGTAKVPEAEGRGDERQGNLDREGGEARGHRSRRRRRPGWL